MRPHMSKEIENPVNLIEVNYRPKRSEWTVQDI